MENEKREPEKKETNKEPKMTMVLALKKPFLFEQKEHKIIDLSGLKELTGSQMIEIEHMLKKEKEIDTVNCEQSVEACVMYASYATGLPEQFFESLPATEFRRVKNMVLNFFMFL